MKHRRTKQWIVSAVACAAAAAEGQTTNGTNAEVVQPVQLERMNSRPVHRVGLNYRMGLNITADFKKLGGLAATSNPDLHTDPAFSNNSVRTYDQGGYVGVDITGNNHGPGFENTTWYFGYNDPGANQVDTLVLTSASSPANAVSKDHTDGPHHGFEVTYSRELFQRGRWYFGAEAALGYTRLSVKDSRRLTATVNRITDTFIVPDGVTLPPPGYQGTYEGPGAVIEAEPGRQTTVVTSSQNTIIGERELEANIFGLRLGPYAELPLNEKFSFIFSGGLYLAVGQSRFSFYETVTVDGTGTEYHSGSHSQLDFLFGGYVGGTVSYALTEDIALLVGAQLQSAGRSVNRAKGKESILNMSESLVVSIGASYSF
jgi:hypothetical protein